MPLSPCDVRHFLTKRPGLWCDTDWVECFLAQALRFSKRALGIEAILGDPYSHGCANPLSY